MCAEGSRGFNLFALAALVFKHDPVGCPKRCVTPAAVGRKMHLGGTYSHRHFYDMGSGVGGGIASPLSRSNKNSNIEF